jgi:hypothetical protein
MKLWLLRPSDWDKAQAEGEPPIAPFDGYNIAQGFVVRADTEQDARKLAETQEGDERGRIPGAAPGFEDEGFYKYGEGSSPWLNPEVTSCVELPVDGKAAVILRDYAAG